MTIKSLPALVSSVMSFFGQRKGLSAAVVVVALAIIAARRSTRAPQFYLYSVRCGINTTAKLTYSRVFANASQPPKRWGSQFTTSVLVECLSKYKEKVVIIPSDLIAGPENCQFDQPTAIYTLVDGVVGYHMTIFYIYRDNGDLHVEFFDGKALPINDPLNERAKYVYDQLQDVKSFKQLERPLQFDAHNCGPLAVWFLDQRLSGRTFEQIAALNPHETIEGYREKMLNQIDAK